MISVLSLFDLRLRRVTALVIISVFLQIETAFATSPLSFHTLEDTTKSVIINQRLIPIAATGSVLYGGSMIMLHRLWYRDFDKQPFTFFNDNDQWLQMDKVGHAMTAYAITEASDHALRYSGVNRRTSVAVGAAVCLSYLGMIEVFDGYSAGWGFSVGDMAANFAGVGVYAGQEWLWDEQRIRMKFNFLPSPYAAYRPDALGNTFAEQMLKDYNGQAYWLSSNLHHWMDAGRWPKWLNFAVGYSARGMTGGRENSFPLLQPGEPVPQFAREREFFLSLDIDLYGIEAKRNWFRAFRTVFGFVKIPAPAIGITSEGNFIGGIR